MTYGSLRKVWWGVRGRKAGGWMDGCWGEVGWTSSRVRPQLAIPAEVGIVDVQSLLAAADGRETWCRTLKPRLPVVEFFQAFFKTPRRAHVTRLFAQIVRQVGHALESCLLQELQRPTTASDVLSARPLKPQEMELAVLERHCAEIAHAGSTALRGERIVSIATDAVRAGFLNRQNTAFMTPDGKCFWGLPQVRQWKLPLCVFLQKSSLIFY